MQAHPRPGWPSRDAVLGEGPAARGYADQCWTLARIAGQVWQRFGRSTRRSVTPAIEDRQASVIRDLLRSRSAANAEERAPAFAAARPASAITPLAFPTMKLA